MAESSPSLAIQLAIEETDKNVFTSKTLPFTLGNKSPISYGGFQIGVALSAALRTVKNNHYLYSATGYYLGPVMTNSTISCVVEEIRNTRTFSTRQVRVMQAGRLCFLITTDFRAAEPSLLTYNTKPSRQYSSWEQCKPHTEMKQDFLNKGVFTAEEVKNYDSMFHTGHRYWECREVPESVYGQNLRGVAKNVKTTQDDLPMDEKTAAEWYRIREPLGDQHAQIAALGFLSDIGLPIMPLTFSHMFLEDAGACSTLDFALRVFTNSLDMNEWHLAEQKTLCGDLGLTYGVTNMFDTKGRLVAQMSQQGILRPKPAKSERGKI